MIYLDNAATGGFKPHAVTEAAITVIKYLCANPGRSGHRLSLTGEKIITHCRERLASMFDARPERVIFTKNCTEGLNFAISGFLGAEKGGRVISTVYEHNSVLRPLFERARSGDVKLTLLSPNQNESLAAALERNISNDVRLVCVTAVSNVTGEAFDIKSVSQVCKANNIALLVDGAQAAGHIPLSLRNDGINMLAIPGHKGMFGIMGSGALILDESIQLSPVIFGGTGTESYNLYQPTNYPERLEAGTLNLPAIAALSEGAKFAADNMQNFGRRLTETCGELITGLSDIRGVNVYSRPNASGIVSFAIDGLPSAEAADILNRDYDIAVRGGLHCAPLMHRRLNTEESGLVRASLAVQNSYREINALVRAVKEISAKMYV